MKVSIRLGGPRYHEPVSINPALYNDPVAFQTDWTPMGTSGSNFATHKLKMVSHDRMDYKLAVPAIIFISIFLIVGIAILIFTFSGHISALPLILGLTFTIIGILMMYFQTIPYIFDKSEGLFYKGRYGKGKPPDIENPKASAYINSIHAVQILEKFVHGKNPYYSYDINLVLKNGQRIFLISHARKDRIRKDAHEIADFLGIPVWDTTDSSRYYNYNMNSF